MSDLTWEDDEKIPFDREPIERKTAPEFKREKKGKTDRKKINPVWYVLVAVIVAVFSVLSYQVITLNSAITDLKKERSTYTMNISAEGGSLGYAAGKGMLSTVSVTANSVDNGGTAETFFSKGMASRGSGVILDVNKQSGDAYILTNFHVVCTTGTLKPYAYRWVLLWDSVQPIAATYIGGSSEHDIAVLKIEHSDEIKNSSCSAVSVGDSTKLTVGESVVAVGNSMARNLRITTGEISKEEDPMGVAPYQMFLEHSADVNSGNSGGGLFNASGDLVGIVNAKFMDVNSSTGELIYNEVIHGMNYAIPSMIAVSIARNIIRNGGQLKTPDLGLELGINFTYTGKNFAVNEYGQGYTTYDLEIINASKGFLVGDKLKSMKYTFEGKEIIVDLNRQYSIHSHMYNLSAGDKITIIVERLGKEHLVNLTIKYE